MIYCISTRDTSCETVSGTQIVLCIVQSLCYIQRDGNCISWATLLAGWTKGTEQWENSYYIRWSQSDHRQNNSNNRNIIINTLLFNYALHCSKSLDLICIREELETIIYYSWWKSLLQHQHSIFHILHLSIFWSFCCFKLNVSYAFPLTKCYSALINSCSTLPVKEWFYLNFQSM